MLRGHMRSRRGGLLQRRAGAAGGNIGFRDAASTRRSLDSGLCLPQLSGPNAAKADQHPRPMPAGPARQYGRQILSDTACRAKAVVRRSGNRPYRSGPNSHRQNGCGDRRGWRDGRKSLGIAARSVSQPAKAAIWRSRRQRRKEAIQARPITRVAARQSCPQTTCASKAATAGPASNAPARRPRLAAALKGSSWLISIRSTAGPQSRQMDGIGRR